MPEISVMFKPASSKCNMACEYCFYHSVAENRELPFRGMMSEELFGEALDKIFRYAAGAPVSLSFQGGEPLLAGKKFFLYVADKIKELNASGSPVNVGIQTNGTLIDEEWCAIFKRNDWLVGLSLDGDARANKYRKFLSGEPAFEAVLRALHLLQRNKVEFNVLVVVTRYIAENIGRVYRFLTGEDCKFLQFIPVLAPRDGKIDESICLDVKVYGEYLKNLFSLYKADMQAGKYVSVRQMDNFVMLANFGRAEQCGMQGGCSRQLVIEGDGAAYPCDFYCTDEYCLGNIAHTEVIDLLTSERAVNFLKESRVFPGKCLRCEWFRLCGGGCRREREDFDKCAAYKEFFACAIRDLKRMS